MWPEACVVLCARALGGAQGLGLLRILILARPPAHLSEQLLVQFGDACPAVLVVAIVGLVRAHQDCGAGSAVGVFLLVAG